MRFHRHVILLGLALVGCATSPKPAVSSTEEVQGPPALVLWSLEVSPGIDLSARFAAYPSGVIIYRKRRPHSEAPRYMQAQLSQEQYARLLGPARVNPLSYLGENYFLAEATEEPDHILQWRTEEDRLRQILVSGVLEEGDQWPDRARTPSAYLSLFDALVAFDSPNARPYIPESFEVILTRAGGGAVAQWPSEWPIPLPASVTTENDERLTAVFPGSRLEQVYRWIWEHERAGQLVGFNGNPYRAQVYVVLPGNPEVLSSSYDAEPIYCH